MHHMFLEFIFTQKAFVYMILGTGHYLSPVERRILGKTRWNLADPPFECYFTEVIPLNNSWWLSRSPLCLHFPSKFEWSLLWILPKFSAIPSFVLPKIKWSPLKSSPPPTHFLRVPGLSLFAFCFCFFIPRAVIECTLRHIQRELWVRPLFNNNNHPWLLLRTLSNQTRFPFYNKEHWLRFPLNIQFQFCNDPDD